MARRRQREPDEAAALLRRLLEAVERGELDATPTVLAFLSGALAALEASLQKPS